MKISDKHLVITIELMIDGDDFENLDMDSIMDTLRQGGSAEIIDVNIENN